MPYLALLYNTETLEVFKISSVISRELRRPPMGKKQLSNVIRVHLDHMYLVLTTFNNFD